MGNSVAIKDDAVEVEIEGWNKLLSFKGSITMPRGAITRVYVRPDDLRPPWVRMPGTHIPTVIAAGTYYGSERTEFWNTRFKDNCIVFELQDFDYTRVVVDVDDPSEILEAFPN